MPRKSPIPEAELQLGRCMKELREALKIPRTIFAGLIGFDGARLVNREMGLAPWQPEEAARAKKVVADHLAAGYAALRSLPF